MRVVYKEREHPVNIPPHAGVGTELEVHLPVGDPVDGGGRWATLEELREPPLLVLPVLHAVRQQRLAEAEARRQEGEKREVQAVVSSLLLRVERQSNEAKGLVASAAAHRHIPAGAAPCAAAIAASSGCRSRAGTTTDARVETARGASSFRSCASAGGVSSHAKSSNSCAALWYSSKFVRSAAANAASAASPRDAPLIQIATRRFSAVSAGRTAISAEGWRCRRKRRIAAAPKA